VKTRWRAALLSAAAGAVVSPAVAVVFFFVVDRIPSTVGPSSTDALKYIALFVLAAMAMAAGAVAGFILGALLDGVVRRRGVDGARALFLSASIAAAIVAGADIALACVGYARARSDQELQDAQYAPGVRTDFAAIRKVPIRVDVVTGVDLGRDASHRLSFKDVEAHRTMTFDWGGRTLEITADRDAFVIHEAGGRELAQRNFGDFSWISEVSFLPVELAPAKSFLFVLSKLRPTSHRSAVSVFTGDGTLVYEEIVELRTLLESAELDGVGRVVVLGRVGCCADTPCTDGLGDFGYAAVGSPAP
jgi:hypothetical protein